MAKVNKFCTYKHTSAINRRAANCKSSWYRSEKRKDKNRALNEKKLSKKEPKQRCEYCKHPTANASGTCNRDLRRHYVT